MRLHHRYGFPLSWDLAIDIKDWAFPISFGFRSLIDGSGRKARVTVIFMSLFCLHWSVHYAWGERRYCPPPERTLSLREVLERDRAEPLTSWQDRLDNDA